MDLTTNYLGFHLKNPVVVAASPASRNVASVRALEDAGVSMVVLFSMFQEQIEHEADAHEHFLEFGAESYAEAHSFMPNVDYYPRTPDAYLEHVAEVKNAVDIPIVASLNGTTVGGWTSYAKRIQQAGADALELNIYNIPSDPDDSAQVIEDRYVEVIRAVRSEVNIPVSVKLGPFFTSLPHFARRLDQAGVEGLVLFNRFYQPDIDLEQLEVKPEISFSTPHEMRLPLRWIAILDPIVEMELAASTGIYTATDVIKLVMAGADVAMLAAALLRHGPRRADEIIRGIRRWMIENEYESIAQMKGSMNHRACDDPSAFERSNYMKALQNYTQ